MDIATIVGVIAVMGAFGFSVIAAGASFKIFYDLPSVVCVCGGTVAAVMLCFPLKNVLSLPKVFLKAFLNKAPDTAKLIKTIVELAETARREGLLALESKLGQIDNKFIVTGIQMAVDGTQPETIEAVLRTEMEAVASRHKDGKQMLDLMGKYAPAMGMVGTLLGLIIMLGNMSDPAAIGPGMAVALITTLYGAIISNAVALPLADKLGLYNKLELTGMEIIIRGVMAIQSGDNPRVIEQKLSSFLPPKLRAGAQEKAA